MPVATVTRDKLAKLGNKKFILHCRSGGRSRRICQSLLTEDPMLEVYNLEGGITAWRDAAKGC